MAIVKFKNIHGDEYDYSKVKYVNNKTNITIVCSKHGDFKQRPDMHIRGDKCRKCAIELNTINRTKTQEEFINCCKLTHDDKYDYSKVNYIYCNDKIVIICPIHGEFEQRAMLHARGYGCQKCKESKGEKKVRQYLEDKKIDYNYQYKFKEKYGGKFDFYISSLNIAIEYNGEQHYMPCDFYSKNIAKKYDNFCDNVRRDLIKSEWCIKNNVKLLIIPYWEYKNIFNILDNVLFDKNYQVSIAPLIVQIYAYEINKIQQSLKIESNSNK